MIVPDALVSVLFQRGAFTADDSAATAVALAIYALGLPAFVLQKVLQPLYFAREDTKTPFRFALVAMVLNAVLAIGLAPVIGYVAAAWGTTLSSWAMVLLLWRGSNGMGQAARIDARLRRRIPRLILASAAMGVCIWIANLALGSLMDMAGVRYLALLGLVLVGIATYFGFGTALGAFSMSDLRAATRK
jgi:putative peptidoglycan lipid II flippase